MRVDLSPPEGMGREQEVRERDGSCKRPWNCSWELRERTSLRKREFVWIWFLPFEPSYYRVPGPHEAGRPQPEVWSLNHRIYLIISPPLTIHPPQTQPSINYSLTIHLVHPPKTDRQPLTTNSTIYPPLPWPLSPSTPHRRLSGKQPWHRQDCEVKKNRHTSSLMICGKSSLS